MNEVAFIEALRKLPLHAASKGLEDDAAILEVGSETLIITHEMLVEGRHFLPSQDMADVAWKLVATNISDLAAKGAQPLGVLLGHMLGADDDRFLEGLDDVLSHYGVPLLGGDTVSGDAPRAFGLTAIGKATYKPVPTRSGARNGDAIFVTGELGAAMLGFEALRNETNADATSYATPLARLAEGIDLAPLVTAMMDISDGLLIDAFRMARASEASFSIESDKVPVSSPERREECLRWGDDYELLFTMPDGTFPPVPATRIGTVEPAGFAPLFLDGEALVNTDGLGYVHE